MHFIYISCIIFWGIFLIPYLTKAQLKQNHLEIRVKNDNAGELSNLLGTGDDLGETYSLLLACKLLTLHPKYNYKLAVESTEFSTLDLRTLEPKDILYNELNHFQLGFDNNKLEDNHFYYGVSLGLNYIQSDKITIGATGQKYAVHQYLLRKFYPKKYWIYNASDIDNQYFPYTTAQYGYTKYFLKDERFSIFSNHYLEAQISTDKNFSGATAKTYWNFRFKNQRFKINAIDIETEALYQTNFDSYQNAYYQIGLRFNSKYIAFYTQIHKPISKNLDNPFIRYNDMEVLFHYGLILFVL